MSTDPELAAIWAQDKNRVIGTGKEMLWSVPADLQFFKSQTDGCPIIMGRRSWEALGGALPGRENIVISSNPDFEATGAKVVTASSWEEALEVARRKAAEAASPTIWVTGGARVYADTLDQMDRLVVTELDLAVDTDGRHIVYAPEIVDAEWEIDPEASDSDWRPQSGEARWRVCVYRPQKDS